MYAPVESGNEQVLFQAGQSIELGTFFSGGDGFQAVIDPGTCITDCEVCCNNWTGFTYDEIPGTIYLILDDELDNGDPTNDIFQVTDVNHPFCAYGAFGFVFRIIDRTGVTVYEQIESNTTCCSFDSPSPEHYMPHAPIFWDGYVTNMFGHRVEASQDTYSYYLVLTGCNGEEAEFQGFITKDILPHKSSSADTTGMTSLEKRAYEDAMMSEKLNAEISLSPNPATDIVSILGVEETTEIRVQLFDEKGTMLTKSEANYNHQIKVSQLSPGTYYCKIYVENNYLVKKFVKL